MSLYRNLALVLAFVLVSYAMAAHAAVRMDSEQEQQQGQSSLPEDSEFFKDTAISSGCYIADQLSTGKAKYVFVAGCNGRDVVELTKDLKEAFQNPAARHDTALAIADLAASHLDLIFPELEGIDAYITTLKAFQFALDAFYVALVDKLQHDLHERAHISEALARLDSERIEVLKARIFAQNKAFVEAAAAYLTSTPGAAGVQFKCSLACQELIAAANGQNVFDNPATTVDSQASTATGQTTINSGPATSTSNGSGRASTSHKALIIGGGVLAGAAVIGGAAVLAASVSCSEKESACSSVVNQCLNQHVNCSQVGSTCAASCQCQGFSSFNTGTGSCQ